MTKAASFDNALAFAADLIAIPGLSGKEDDVARRLFQEMEALGLADVRVDDAGNVWREEEARLRPCSTAT